jgi:hypothetical protein
VDQAVDKFFSTTYAQMYFLDIGILAMKRTISGSVFGSANLNFLVTKNGNLLLISNHHLHNIQIFQHNAVGYSSIQRNPGRVGG